MSAKEKGTSFNKKQCDNCGDTAALCCSNCKLVSYCSKSCQTQHWKAIGGHKKFCIKLSDRKPVASRLPITINKPDDLTCLICLDRVDVFNDLIMCHHCLCTMHTKCKKDNDITTKHCPHCNSDDQTQFKKDILKLYETANIVFNFSGDLKNSDAIKAFGKEFNEFFTILTCINDSSARNKSNIPLIIVIAFVLLRFTSYNINDVKIKEKFILFREKGVFLLETIIQYYKNKEKSITDKQICISIIILSNYLCCTGIQDLIQKGLELRITIKKELANIYDYIKLVDIYLLQSNKKKETIEYLKFILQNGSIDQQEQAIPKFIKMHLNFHNLNYIYYLLGDLLINNNPTLAIAYYDKACKLKELNSFVKLSNIYSKTNPVKSNLYKLAFEELVIIDMAQDKIRHTRRFNKILQIIYK